MAYPRFRLARAFRYKTLASATTTTFTTTTPVQIDATLDLVLEAQVGDVIECGISAYWPPSTVAYYGTLDVQAVQSGIYWSSETTTADAGGVPAWQSSSTPTGSSVSSSARGSVMRQIVASDIDANGRVTMRPMGFLSAAGSRALTVSTATRFHFWVKNLGPPDPE